jgi:23S rRNA G2069 N7-methylase RlmK/C1962 C5-methylase RlmI
MNKEIIMKTLEKQLSLNLSSLKIQDIIWRQSEGRLEQDGYVKEKKNNNLNLEGQEIVEKEEVLQAKAIEEVQEEENDEENEELRKMKFDPNECCVGKENGLEYYISPRKGQKTGFYCDQRENRAFLSSLVKDKNVLDLFCYTGGFSLNAMKGQAQTVVGVDSSQKAINTARANVELNQFDSNKIQFVKEDSEKFMSSANENGLHYDVVILDPPKLAPNTKALPRAVNKYKKLNVAALKLVKPGGLLLSCTCSSAVTMSGDFLKIITASAVEAGRHITVLRQSSTSLDHVTNPNYMETNYLTAILVVVH